MKKSTKLEKLVKRYYLDLAHFLDEEQGGWPCVIKDTKLRDNLVKSFSWLKISQIGLVYRDKNVNVPSEVEALFWKHYYLDMRDCHFKVLDDINEFNRKVGN